MTDLSVQFQGTRSPELLLFLLAAVAVALAVHAMVQLSRQRWRQGLLSLAAALGPVVVPALLADAAAQALRGESRGAWRSLLGAALGAGGVALAAALAVWGQGLTAVWAAGLGLEITLAVGVFYGAVYAHLGAARLGALMALRVLGIAALLAILFKPALSLAPPEGAIKPVLPVVVDRSASMATADQGGAERYRQAIEALAIQAPRMDKVFRVQWRHFAQATWNALDLQELGELRPQGDGTGATDLSAALRSAVRDQDRASLPGVLLLTDGIANAGDDAQAAGVEAGVPLFVAAVGSGTSAPAGAPNAQVLALEGPLDAVANNISTFSVRVGLESLANLSMEARLYENDSPEPVATVPLYASKASETLTREIKWTPRPKPTAGQADRRKLRLVIPTAPGEARADDNAVEFHVLVTEPRIRVLYVQGTMGPEFKFLRRLLDSDPNVQLVSMVRTRGSSFLSQGQIDGRQLETIPARGEELKLFDVIILGDLDRTFLTDDQLARLREFVNDGGGLLMIGGHNSLGPGGYGQTDLETALPVVVGSRRQAQETTPLVPQLSAAGRVHPIFEGIAGYFGGPDGQKPDPKLPALPELRGCVTVVSAKPAAQVLAVHPMRSNENGPLVVLAVQPFGAGRSAVFAADTTSQWFMKLSGLGVDSPYDRFWGQMVRWLANADTRSRSTASSLVLRLERTCVSAGQPVRVVARLRDGKAQPPSSAVLGCRLTPSDGQGPPEDLTLAYHSGAGVYETTFTPRATGKFLLQASASDAQGQALGADELALTVLEASAETQQLSRNDALLGRLAEVSGGRLAELTGLPELVDQLIARSRARSTPQAKPRLVRLYHFPLLFVAFAVVITGEWLLRRRWQLH